VVVIKVLTELELPSVCDEGAQNPIELAPWPNETLIEKPLKIVIGASTFKI